jgi:hypothetical protein
MKRIRDTERPPATSPSKDVSPVSVSKSTAIHFAARRAPPFFVADETLCGKKVEALVALPATHVSCSKCVALAKASA